jgi:hypothetical protein
MLSSLTVGAGKPDLLLLRFNLTAATISVKGLSNMTVVSRRMFAVE